MLSVDNLVEIFNNNSSLAIIISVGLSIAISLAGILPSIFVTGANIIFFGPIKGFIISLIGETIGGYITFKVYRMGLKKGMESIRGKYKLLDKLVKSHGGKAGMLVFEGRLIPFMPSGFVTLAASLSNIDAVRFNVATLFGKAPSIALEAMISYDVINIKQNYIRLGFTLISLILIVITMKIFSNKTT